MAIDIIARGMIESSKSDISQLFDITKGGEIVNNESSYTLNNAVDYPLLELNLYGKSTQDGVPTPDNPVDIVSVGDGGTVGVTACSKNLCKHNIDYTWAGVSAKSNSDGSITLNGTTTATNAYAYGFNKVYLVQGHKYYIAFYSDNTCNVKFTITGIYTNAQVGTSHTFINNKKTGWYTLALVVAGNVGQVINDITAYPLLMDAEIADTSYEPYKGNTANITSALPLCGIPVSEGGNYTDSTGQEWICDELVYNADGTGKIVKNLWGVTLDGSDDEIWVWGEKTETNRGIFGFSISKSLGSKYKSYDRAAFTTEKDAISNRFKWTWYRPNTTKNTGLFDTRYGGLSFNTSNFETIDEWKTWLSNNPTTVVYKLETPFEVSLSESEMQACRQLQTFDGITNITNDSGAEMSVKFCTNKALSEYVFPITMGLQKQIDELKAAVISLGGNV